MHKHRPYEYRTLRLDGRTIVAAIPLFTVFEWDISSEFWTVSISIDIDVNPKITVKLKNAATQHNNSHIWES